MLNRSVRFRDPDHRQWWEKLGPIIAAHLEAVNYSVGGQYQHMLCFIQLSFQRQPLSLIPKGINWFGRHVFWASHGEPWEIGVNYQQGSKSCVRIAVEPVGPDAGTERGPINELTARQLLEDPGYKQTGIDFI